jgi:hypothetical protein
LTGQGTAVAELPGTRGTHAAVIRELRRGGWRARGVVRTQRSGQIFETQVGPRAFENQEASREWLRDVAIRLAIDDAHLIVSVDGVNGRR